jgi:Mn2+/Fe2+ NRAMP family transporter
LVSPALNFPGFIAQRQVDFLGLNPANTLVSINPLQPSFASFATNAPQALWHSLGRPTFFDGKLSLMLLPFALESTVYATLIIVYFISGKQRRSFNQPIILFGFFFSISICLVIGYTVPILGAVVRYRAIYLPFLLGPFICCTDWRSISGMLNINK